MSSAPDDRLLRLAEDLADGKAAQWDDVLRLEPDLAPALERFRQLQAIAAAHETSAREQREDPWRAPKESLKTPFFSWGEIQVFEKLGEGGYAEVFRAWDPALEREVALKLNRSDAALSATGLQRWLDEARRLARVRHPNILVIHGVDVRDGRAGFWTDLVRGQTLEQVLQEQGRLGGAEALLVGLDLCRALAAVHVAGLVHGDLKTSNVMREGGAGEAAGTAAGRIVLTDFGASTESSPSISRSAAFATPLTCAPEVLRGEPPSPASDLYSLGVLLYRLVAARYPIESTDPTELEAKIQYGLRTPLRDLRPDLGAAFVAVVERALDPDPRRRYSSAGEMERSLGEALSEGRLSARESVGAPTHAGPTEEGAVVSPRGHRWRASLGVTVIAIAIASLAIVWWGGRRRPPGPGPIRFTIGAPPHKLIRTDPNQFAISPDGSTLAFIAYDSTGQSLWVRRLGNHKPRELAGTPGAASPFWSPDGKQIGFFSEGKMRRVGLNGEAPEVICDAPQPHGASWGRRDVIVFAPGNGSLFRVPASGGTPESVTTIDTTGGVNAHAWPGFLPDGEHFTYVARRIEPFSIDDAPRPGPWTSYVGSIRTKRSNPLLSANSVAMYAPPHHVIYIRDGILLAQRFDVRQLRVEGRPIQIADSPAPHSYVGSRCGSVSANGVLVWRSMGSPKTRLVWIDRSARPIREAGVPPDRWVRALISPDGRRVILLKETPTEASLWLFDFERGTLTGLTSGPERLELGVWSPDSKEILYRRHGPASVSDVRRMAVDQPESDSVFYRSSGRLQNAFGWSPDGRWVLVQDVRDESDSDLLQVPASGGAATPYLAARFAERQGKISPDGRWVLYLTNELRSQQACVQSFPIPGRKQQVSTLPVIAASWCLEGREIFLFGRDYRLRSVPIEGDKEMRLGAPRELFALPNDIRWLAPMPDGQRFLLLEPQERTAKEPSIEVNVNWMAGLSP